MDTEAVVRRFRQERQLLADLEHPFIARLLDGGATEDGLPYLVMEHVDGEPLVRYCETQELEWRARLELMSQVCQAVGFAHSQGIVHCDLKPSNVFVDAKGAPKLLDFGIAKVLNPEEGSGLLERTRTGDRFLSPRYASPEQIRGEPVERASDVYGLGVVLYELLTGVHPHGQITSTWRAFEGEVTERRPTAPSKAVRVAGPPAPPEGRSSRSRALRGDVDTIVLTALRKEPDRRYADAGALGADIDRFLQDRPIRARRDTWRYRSRKFLERHRALATGTILFILLLCSALVVTWQLYQASENARQSSEWNAYTSGLIAAESALRDGATREARRSLSSVPENRRDWIWRHLESRTDRSAVLRPLAGEGPALRTHGCALDREGGRVAVASEGRLEIIELESKKTTWTSDVPPAWGRCGSLTFSPDGDWLVAAFAGKERVVAFERSGDTRRDVPGTGPRDELAYFHPLDGRLFVASGATIRVLDPRLDSEITRFAPHASAATDLAFSPDGTRVATVTFHGAEAAITDARTLRTIHALEGHTWGLYSAAFSPSSKWLATGSLDGVLRVWDVDSGALEVSQDLRRGNVIARFLASDDELVVSTPIGLFLWDMPSRSIVSHWLGGGGGASLLVDRKRASVLSGDDTGLRSWSFDTRDLRVLPAGEWSATVAFDSLGTRLWNVGPDGDLRGWSLDGFDETDRFGEPGSRWTDLAIAPSGEALLTIDSRGRVVQWDPDGQSFVLASGLNESAAGRACTLCFDRAGERVLRTGRNSDVEVLHADTGALLHTLASPDAERTLAAAWFPDGRRAVGVTASGSLVIHDTRRAEVEASYTAESAWMDKPSPGTSVVIDPHTDTIVTAHADGTLIRWSTKEGPTTWARQDANGASSLAVHPSGILLAVGRRHAVQLWNLERFEPIVTLSGHGMTVSSLAFSPDGEILASSSYDGTIRLWETE